jgi:hypothetical protein
MTRILSIAFALALAGTGSIALAAGPSGAQEDELDDFDIEFDIQLEARGAEISPSVAAPGAQVTVTETNVRSVPVCPKRSRLAIRRPNSASSHSSASVHGSAATAMAIRT